MNKNSKFYFSNAFTLLELIISIGIFSLVIVVWMSLFIKGLQLFPLGLRQSEAIGDAQKGINTMVKEIRSANMAENGNYTLEQASDFSFIFYSDIDHDSRVERVRYFIEDKKFKQGIINPTGNPVEYLVSNEIISVLAKNIKNSSSPVFYYYDGNNNVLPTEAILTQTKMMKVRLEIDVGRGRDYILESYTQIRNLKENL